MIGIFPLAILLELLAVGALIYAVVSAVKRVKNKWPLGWKQIALFLFPSWSLMGWYASGL